MNQAIKVELDRIAYYLWILIVNIIALGVVFYLFFGLRVHNIDVESIKKAPAFTLVAMYSLLTTVLNYAFAEFVFMLSIIYAEPFKWSKFKPFEIFWYQFGFLMLAYFIMLYGFLFE